MRDSGGKPAACNSEDRTDARESAAGFVRVDGVTEAGGPADSEDRGRATGWDESGLRRRAGDLMRRS